MVLDKIRTDGLLPTIETVRSKLDKPLPLGYSNVGIMINAEGLESERRIVSNGHHAEYVCVPNNLLRMNIIHTTYNHNEQST